MTKSEFLQLIKEPHLMTKEQSFDLEDVVNDFPFFQAARVLYLKGLKNQNSFRYNQSLKTTSIYTVDRTVLFDFITSNSFENKELNSDEQNLIEQWETIDRQVHENVYGPEISFNENLEIEIPQENESTMGDVPSEEEPINFTSEINSFSNENSTTENELIDDEQKNLHSEENLIENTDNIPAIEINPISESHVENSNDFLNIDEIADAFIKKIEAENELIPKTSSEIEAEDELIPKTSSEIGAENELNENTESVVFIDENSIEESVENKEEEVELEIPAFLSYDKISEDYKSEESNIDLDETEFLSEIVAQEKEENTSDFKEGENEKETEFNTDPIEKIEVTSTIENLEEEKDAMNFEFLPNEVLRENNLVEAIFEPIKISLDREFSPPVEFQSSDSHSFSNWLKISTFKPIDRTEKKENKGSLDEKLDLIEDFIIKNPKIEPIKDHQSTEAKPIQNYDNEEIMTETLARVYVLQHKYADAIKAYQILSLKFPEKSSFFADQIKQIEILKKNNFN